MTNREYMIEHFDAVVRKFVDLNDEECFIDLFMNMLTLPRFCFCNDNCIECINEILSLNHRIDKKEEEECVECTKNQTA